MAPSSAGAPIRTRRGLLVAAVAATMLLLAGGVLLYVAFGDSFDGPGGRWGAVAGLLALIGAASAGSWVVFAIKLAGPIERLAATARRMTGGASLIQVGPNYSAGEIGQVERAFDAMVETIVYQKAAVEEARASLADAFTSLGDGIALYDARERLVFCNEKFREIYASIADMLVPGARLEDLVSAYVERMGGDADGTGQIERENEIFARHRNHEKNVLIRGADDRWFRASHYATPNGGEVMAVSDVTDEVEAVESLRRSEERFRALAETVPTGIYRMDPAGAVVFANEAWRQITGLSPTAAAASDWEAAIHPDDKEYVDEGRLETLRDGRELRLEYRLRRADGSVRWVQDIAAPEHDFDGGLLGFVGTLADITEKREVQTRLEQSRRLEALGQVTGGLAHDFNNLLMIVLGNAEMLEDIANRGDEIKPDRLLRLARTVISAAERSTQLTQSLLGFARRRSVKPEKVSVHRRLQDLGELLKRSVGSQIKLEFALAATRDEVMIDLSQFENAIINLVLNARDATSGGGRVTISTRNVVVGEPRPVESELVPGEYLALAIADTGTGMAPEVAVRALEPFFTTKPEGSATGMGLSLVYGVVKQAQGETRIETEPGRGTTVTLFLPVVEASSATEAPARISGTPAKTAKRRVLVVDDDPPVLSVMSAQLDRLGWEPVGVSSAEAALRLVRGNQPFDLMFSDVDLGVGLDGFELARQVRMLRPDLSILMTTGKLIERAGADGSPPVLPKPFTQRELAEKLREVVGDAP